MDKFSVGSCAAYVYQTVNARYYSKLLEAIETEAARLGYGFEETSNTAVSPLPHDVHTSLAQSLLRAKESHLVPRADDATIELYVERQMEEGFGATWLDEILFALELRGVRLVRRDAQVSATDEMQAVREALYAGK